jgi:hypothetical protein
MADKFLVVLREHDQLADIVPALEKIIRPGSSVTFLLSYPVNSWSWLRDHWITTESTRRALASGKRLVAEYSWEEQMRLAEKKIAFAHHRLAMLGVDVAVMLKSGFNRAVRDYIRDPNFQLLLVATANGHATVELARLLFLCMRHVSRRSVVSLVPCYRAGEITGR